MDYLSIAAASLAGLSTLLLIVVLVQLKSLGKAVESLAASRAQAAPPIRKEEGVPQAIAAELKKIEQQIGGFDIVFSEIQDRLSILRPDRAGAPVAAAGAGLPTRESPGRAVPVADVSTQAPPAADREPAEPAPAPSPRPPEDDLRASPAPDRQPGPGDRGPPPAARDSSLARLQELVGEYRELIAEPRKNEINRWCDDAGGWACEVGDDGTLRPLSREAGGLLVLISLEESLGVVVPGGRLVVDFPTDFANTIAMRRVTRQSFELINDGTGVLRLTEAAVAQRIGDKWQLVRPGTLAGLKSE